MNAPIAIQAAPAIPAWLTVMRSITGTQEVPGPADSADIMKWPRYIAQQFPDMASYCAQYNHDAIAWCGLTVAYCMARAGMRPVFGADDTDKFLWAAAWAKFGERIASPRLGCILVFQRPGGGHVAMYEGEDGDNFLIRGGNQSDAVNVMRMPKARLVAAVWPAAHPPGPAPGPAPTPSPPPIPKPPKQFERCIPLLLASEGGNDDDPRDPGGRTSRGITQSEWNIWRRSHAGLPADVWQAPQAQVIAIYRQNYWNVVNADALPVGVDYCVFDFGVNSGNSRAAKFLQRRVGTDQDGEIGPLTIAATARAVQANGAADLVDALCADRLAFLRALAKWSTYGHGWKARVDGVRVTAETWIKHKETNMQGKPNVVVPVKPSTESKINWTQLAGPIASIIAVVTGGQMNLTSEQILSLVLAIQGGQSLVTWIFRTWFTKSVTPASIAT
jgi:uncharacterized protein (TIGR02594 family)